MKEKVMFVCVHNSARSQMAEALLNHHCPEDFFAESGGLEPGELNPLAVEVMGEIGIDIAGQPTKSVFELFQSGRLYSHVIALCDAEASERCPIFPGFVQRHSWSFENPQTSGNSREERISRMRLVRDQIQQRILAWCAERCVSAPNNR